MNKINSIPSEKTPNFSTEMSNITPLLTDNPLHTKILESAVKLGAKLGIPTFIVGGFVRDKLMNRPTTDIDIMVEGDGVGFAKELAKELKINTVVDYEKFGTALIPHSDVEIEIATARKEFFS